MNKRLLPALFAALLCLPAGVLAADTPPAGVWSADPAATPASPPPPAGKVLVIAKIEEPNKRRMVEEALRAELALKGVEALTAVQHLTDADFASADALKQKAESLGVDGVLGLTVEGHTAQVKSSPTVSLGVGIPIHAGPFSVYAGASKPIGGGPKMVHTVALRLRFYNRPGDPAWEKVEKKKFEEDELDQVASITAQRAVKELKKKKLIAAK